VNNASAAIVGVELLAELEPGVAGLIVGVLARAGCGAIAGVLVHESAAARSATRLIEMRSLLPSLPYPAGRRSLVEPTWW